MHWHAQASAQRSASSDVEGILSDIARGCSHVFWDNQHLTQAMHANIAKIFLRDTAPLFWEAVPPAGSPLPDIKITPAPGPLVTLAGLAHIVGLYG